MANPSGHISGDMKWFVYRYPQKPNTLMALGSILTKPDDLESSLNYEAGIKAFHADGKLDQTVAVQRVIHAELSKELGGRLKALLPTLSPMVNIGGGVEGRFSDTSEATINASGISAEVIKRDAAGAYINEALQIAKVSEYVKRGLWAKSLYMIIGVAKCKKLVMGDSENQERTFSTDLDANLAVMGLEAGVGSSMGNKVSLGTEVEIQEDCDFAYRVREFQYSRFRKGFKKATDVTDGALFGQGSGLREVPLTSAEIEALYDEVPIFDGFESEDEEFDSPDGMIIQIPE